MNLENPHSRVFQPLNTDTLSKILGLTIKHDNENKVATFLCALSAYSEDSQFNISFNAPSSTGKSFIPTEIAKLFPPEDVIEVGYCSPTAFFHDVGVFDKDRKVYFVDLSHKILIFLDQPRNDLLARLRPLLSHGKKEITTKITDKSQKDGLRTKTILLRGYPSVMFCTAGLTMDEQEATRFLLLSPEINEAKIVDGINATIARESDNHIYNQELLADSSRAYLIKRIRIIRDQKIQCINLPSPREISDRFVKMCVELKPKHQRDIKRLISLIKAMALLNCWWREQSGNTITANQDDIDHAFKLWEKISQGQEYNIPPYVYTFYQEVIESLWQEDALTNGVKRGISRQEMCKKYFQVRGAVIEEFKLRQQILPMLENVGLITQKASVDDKRRLLVFPPDKI